MAAYYRYRSCISWLNKCIDEGHYIEAITLDESLIADRLEVLCGDLVKPTKKYRTVGVYLHYIDEAKKCETIGFDYKTLQLWWESRNKYVHGMAKELEDGLTFNERKSEAKEVAQKGIEVFRAVDKVVQNKKKED